MIVLRIDNEERIVKYVKMKYIIGILDTIQMTLNEIEYTHSKQ